MSLAHGGHLTHGHPVSVSGQLWNAVQYGVRESDGLIDYDQVAHTRARSTARASSWRAPAPTRASSTSNASPPSRARSAPPSSSTWRTSPASSPPGSIPSPVPHADLVTSTTHKTLRGPRGGFVLREAGVGREARQDGVPGAPGRSAHARHRRQGGVLRRGAHRRLPALPAARRRQRPRLGGVAQGARLSISFRAAPTTI